MKTMRSFWNMRCRRGLAFLLAALMLTAAGCTGEKKPDPAKELQPEVTETEAPGETAAPETEQSEPETEESEPETEATETPETEEVPTLPDADELLTDPDSEITAFSDDPDTEADRAGAQKTQETEAPADEEPAEAEEEKRIFNYCNGCTTTEEERDKRPVAIMINNIKNCLPQDGICDGDIYYECTAEGGITRIMMVVSDYEKLGTVGSVRSSRDYFVDFLSNHDAIYVHAGGSGLAYEKIIWRGTNNLDGVNMYTGTTFWRDMDRWNRLGMEHSLMTSGQGIVDGINYQGYRTELDPNQVPLFNFYDEKTDHKLVGSPASHVHMIMTPYQTVDFVYNEETGEYLRYQYNGMPHVDGITGEQLSVKNVLILFTDISLIPGDEAGRMSVGTVGSGQGYYITNGKRKVVNWSRDGKTSTLHLEYRNGDELILNCGKTYICVVDNTVARKIDFEYEW